MWKMSLDAVGIFLILPMGLFLGYRSTRGTYRWIFGYVVPVVLMFLIGILRHLPQYAFAEGFQWVLRGRNEFFPLAVIGSVLAGNLIPRIPRLRLKILVGIFMSISALYYCVSPFVLPIFLYRHHQNIQTTVDHAGVCIQQTRYTCGPAAAVTALRQLGIEAQEGQLAIQAYSSPVSGTPEDWLSQAIETLYGNRGVHCSIRSFDSVDQLKGLCPIIAVVEYAPLVDHYITILQMRDDVIVVGDPAVGKEYLTYDDFKKRWRYIGISVKRK
jgi:predicted double-glycine peptidase